ncbi:antitoxin [Arthrobacter rhombi]|uniref:antitoxin n=1 Tax=Arthrobacter rhombi TaxID=71253 RepID=UPI003FD15E43
MSWFSRLRGLTRKQAVKHQEKIERGIDKTETHACNRLDPKYGKHIQSGSEKARQGLNHFTRGHGGPPS